MIKYVKVDWPESQKFSDNERCYLALSNDPTDYEPSGNTYMVPEDLYEEVMYKLQFPKKYENTELGTIVCYETRAIINGEDVYWYDEDMIEKGSSVLVYNHTVKNRPKWIISKCVSCSWGFPIILEDALLCPGINCEIIGIKNN